MKRMFGGAAAKEPEAASSRRRSDFIFVQKKSYRCGTPLTSKSGFVFHLGVQPGFSTLVRKMTVLSRAMSSVQMNFAPSKSFSK